MFFEFIGSLFGGFFLLFESVYRFQAQGFDARLRFLGSCAKIINPRRDRTKRGGQSAETNTRKYNFQAESGGHGLSQKSGHGEVLPMTYILLGVGLGLLLKLVDNLWLAGFFDRPWVPNIGYAKHLEIADALPLLVHWFIGIGFLLYVISQHGYGLVRFFEQGIDGPMVLACLLCVPLTLGSRILMFICPWPYAWLCYGLVLAHIWLNRRLGLPD